MAKDTIPSYSTTNASNTDIGGVGIAGTNNISNLDNAIREMMTHLAETNAGTSPWADTMCIADPADLSKKLRHDCGNITTATTRVVSWPDADVTIPSGTIVTTSATQTLTGKTLTSPVLTTPQINDTSSDHQYIFAGSELAADRTVTLPLLTANDEFVFKAHNIQAQATWEAGVGTTESLVTPAKIAAAIAALTTTPNYGTGNAALSYGGVGTYVFGLIRNTGVTDGSTYAGSAITPAGFRSNSGTMSGDASDTDIAYTSGGSALSGTWRAMSRANATSGFTRDRLALFLRTV